MLGHRAAGAAPLVQRFQVFVRAGDIRHGPPGRRLSGREEADETERASRSLMEPAKPDDPVGDDEIAAVAAALKRGRKWLDRPSSKVEEIRARLNHGRTWIPQGRGD